MDKILLKLKDGIVDFTPALSAFLYSNTIRGSLLRLVIVHHVARCMPPTLFSTQSCDWDTEFTQELCLNLMVNVRRLWVPSKKDVRPSLYNVKVVTPGIGFTQADNPGTVGWTFKPVKEKDPSSTNTTNVFQSITMAPNINNKFSFEELRLFDYSLNNAAVAANRKKWV